MLSSIINNPDNKALFANSEYSSPVNYLSLANAAVIAYNSMANSTPYILSSLQDDSALENALEGAGTALSHMSGGAQSYLGRLNGDIDVLYWGDSK